MSWSAALKSFLEADVKNIEAKLQIFERVSRHFLLGPRNSPIRSDHFSLLRRLRWEILKDGTGKNKSDLLECILRTLSQANEKRHYHHQSNSGGEYLPQAGRPPMNDLRFISEQLQCVAEAGMCGIALGPQHFRHLLLSPQLRLLNERAPVLLLQAMQKSDGNSQEDPQFQSACVDCCAGLATSGYIDEASTLLSINKISLESAIKRIVELRKGGWEAACRLVHCQKKSTPSADWVEGACVAAVAQYKATKSPVAHDFIAGLYKDSGKQTPPSILSAFLETTQSSQWELMLQTFYEAGKQSPKDFKMVGRLMKALLRSNKPALALHLFYGKDRYEEVFRGATSGKSDTISGFLTDATGKDISRGEAHHPAIYNYAMECWACLGSWDICSAFYKELETKKPNLVNRHTHKQIIRIVFQNKDPLGLDLSDKTLYWFCHSVLEKVMALSINDNEVHHFIETFLLWTALRFGEGIIEVSEAVSLSKGTPDTCRYARIIVVGMLLRKADSEALAVATDLLTDVIEQPSCSYRQLCLLAVFFVSQPFSCGRFHEGPEDLLVSKFAKLLNAQGEMDSFIDVLVEYGVAVRRRQTSTPTPRTVAPDALRQERLLAGTLDTLLPTQAHESMWDTLIQFVRRVGETVTLSPARLGPAMVSFGVDAEVAMSAFDL